MSEQRTDVVLKTDLGVTANAQLLLCFIALSTALVREDGEDAYRLLEAHSADGTLLLENVNSKNTYLVSVVQLTGVDHV